MALSEGWAYYNEWRVAQKYLNFNSFTNENWSVNNRKPDYYDLIDNYFPKYFARMFYELNNIGCSIGIMEKAMSTNSLAIFKNNLVAYYPTMKNNIETTIAKYE